VGTVRDYFDTDFKRDVVAGNEFTVEWTPTGASIAIPARIHLDFDSNALFICFYVPQVPDLAVLMQQSLVGLVERLLAKRLGPDVSLNKEGEAPARSVDLKFAGRVFVYAEGDLTDAQLTEVSGLLRARDLYLRFRGPRYAQARSAQERPLAFISYDSSDRDTIAQPLAKELTHLRCPTWFDGYQMRAGDDIERSIVNGLRECERCIVILSERYVMNQRWARREFDEIIARENHERRSLIIPIRHGVTTEHIASFSHTLAHRRAIDWDAGRVHDIAVDLSVTLLSIAREHEWESAMRGATLRRWSLGYRVGRVVGRLFGAFRATVDEPTSPRRQSQSFLRGPRRR
jgi:hypothetical protein